MQFEDMGFDIGIEWIFLIAEEFCNHKNIPVEDIPPLYIDMFEAKSGFLTQAKSPMILSRAWRKIVSTLPSLTASDESLLQEFLCYSSARLDTDITTRDKNMHEYVIDALQTYLKKYPLNVPN